MKDLMEVRPEGSLCRSETSLSISVNNPDQLPVSFSSYGRSDFVISISQDINRILSYTIKGTVFPDKGHFERTVELREGAETSFDRYFEIYQR